MVTTLGQAKVRSQEHLMQGPSTWLFLCCNSNILAGSRIGSRAVWTWVGVYIGFQHHRQQLKHTTLQKKVPVIQVFEAMLFCFSMLLFNGYWHCAACIPWRRFSFSLLSFVNVSRCPAVVGCGLSECQVDPIGWRLSVPWVSADSVPCADYKWEASSCGFWSCPDLFQFWQFLLSVFDVFRCTVVNCMHMQDC